MEKHHADAASLGFPDVDWTQLPPGAAAVSFAAPSGRLAGVGMGGPPSEPVLLAPGAMGSKEDFSLMMPVLAAAGYYTVSYDLAGHYGSAAAGPENLVPPRRHYDYGLFVDDLLAVLALLGPSHVVGHSFSGIVAQAAYAKSPGMFRSLSLISCPPVPGLSFRGVRRIGWLAPLAGDRISAALIVWGVRHNIIPVPPSRLRFVHQRFEITRRDAVRDVVSLMRHAPDLRAVIAAAPVPKFVAVGSNDVWPLDLHARFARDVGARITVYRTGHSPSESCPEDLSRDLLTVFRAALGPQEPSHRPENRRNRAS